MQTFLFSSEDVTSNNIRRSQWRSQPKNLGGAKMFDFRRITLFCLEKRLSKHKMTIFFKTFWGGMAPLTPRGYAYGRSTWCRRSFIYATSEMELTQ